MILDTIKCGDCIDVFKTIPDDVFDLSFADPPFNLKKDYNEYEDRLSEEKYIEWCKLWIMEMVRVTKPNGTIIIHNIPKWLVNYASVLESAGAIFRHWIAWDASSGIRGKSLQPNHYGFLYYVLGDNHTVHPLRSPHRRCQKFLFKDYGGKIVKINPFGTLLTDVWTDIYRKTHVKIADQLHPCSLPVHLLERIILLCTNEGDVVFDCFAGTGTAMVASKRLNRKYFGVELSQEYVNLAEIQLKDQPLSKINGIWMSCHLGKIHTVRNCDIMNGSEFRSEWKDIWKEWPETKDQKRNLKHTELILKSEYKNEINYICGR